MKVFNKMNHAVTKTGVAAKAAINTAAIYGTLALTRLNAMALDIKTDFTVKDTTGINPEGLIIGLAFWIARLIGIGMLVWGVYGYVTARKDGEAESMNGALGKLISGLVLIGMPSIFKALNIIG